MREGGRGQWRLTCKPAEPLVVIVLSMAADFDYASLAKHGRILVSIRSAALLSFHSIHRSAPPNPPVAVAAHKQRLLSRQQRQNFRWLLALLLFLLLLLPLLTLLRRLLLLLAAASTTLCVF